MWEFVAHVTEHHVMGLGLLLVAHGVVRIIMMNVTATELQAKHVDALIWNAVAVGSAVAWAVLFRSLYPLSAPPWQNLLDLMMYVPLYFDVLYVVVAYYAVSSFLLGTADWKWLLTHTWMFVLMLGVGLAGFGNDAVETPHASMMLRLFLLSLRYQLWLACYSFFMLQTSLVPATSSGRSRAVAYWYLACMGILACLHYDFCLWALDLVRLSARAWGITLPTQYFS